MKSELELDNQCLLSVMGMKEIEGVFFKKCFKALEVSDYGPLPNPTIPHQGSARIFMDSSVSVAPNVETGKILGEILDRYKNNQDTFSLRIVTSSKEVEFMNCTIGSCHIAKSSVDCYCYSSVFIRYRESHVYYRPSTSMKILKRNHPSKLFRN